MNRLTALSPENANGNVKNLFDAVQKKLGMVGWSDEPASTVRCRRGWGRRGRRLRRARLRP